MHRWTRWEFPTLNVTLFRCNLFPDKFNVCQEWMFHVTFPSTGIFIIYIIRRIKKGSRSRGVCLELKHALSGDVCFEQERSRNCSFCIWKYNWIWWTCLQQKSDPLAFLKEIAGNENTVSPLFSQSVLFSVFILGNLRKQFWKQISFLNFPAVRCLP